MNNRQNEENTSFAVFGLKIKLVTVLIILSQHLWTFFGVFFFNTITIECIKSLELGAHQGTS
jgi:hypothetical protein